MELRQLAYVVAVAEEGSFTRAAAREHVAQPGVSAQVRRLEAELGLALFNRGPTSVTLTAAGEAVLPFARAALTGAAGVRTALAELTGLIHGRVALGVVTSLGGWLAEPLAAFHAEHPAVEITLAEERSDVLIDGVRAGRLDFALAGIAGAPPAGVATATVVDEELVAAVAPGHPLAGRAAISLAALQREPLVALPRGTGSRTALEEAMAAAGLPSRVAFEAADPLVVVDLARRGLGAAVVPATAPEGLHVLRITPPVRSRLDLVWRADAAQSPAAAALLERVSDGLAGHG